MARSRRAGVSALKGASATLLGGALLAGCSIVYDNLGQFSAGGDPSVDAGADTSTSVADGAVDDGGETGPGPGDTGTTDAPADAVPDVLKTCTTVGPVAAGSVSVVGQGVGWTNPQSVTSEDGMSAVAGGLTPANEESKTLFLNGFGLAIPAGAQIMGVEVRIRARGQSVVEEDVRDAYLQLAPGGAVSGADKGDKKWTSNFVTRSYGGAADVWGLALTPANLNSPLFAIGFRAKFDGAGSGDALVDAIRVLVTYCE